MTIHRQKNQEQYYSLPGSNKAEAEKNACGGLTPIYVSFSMKTTRVLVYHLWPTVFFKLQDSEQQTAIVS